MHPKALLDICAELLTQVLTLEHPADAVVAQFFRDHRQIGSRERHALSDTVYAVLRDKRRLEWLARERPAGTSLQRALALLGWRGDEAWRAAALSSEEGVWLTQADARPPADWPLPCRHGLPDWLAQALAADLPADWLVLAEALNRPAPLDLRVNALKGKRAAVQQRLVAEGWQAAPTPYAPWGLRLQGKPSLARSPAFQEGWFEIQDEGSQLLALLVEPRRQDTVVDFCAGAGGKTLALGAAMRNTGRLYAFDISAHRLEGLKPRLARSGLTEVHTMALAHERDERLQRLQGKADRVLVDAPCSGLGTLRRSPDLKWRQTPATVEALTAQQRSILATAARLVKPGGRLVYATCSLLRAENEAVAEAFGAEQRDFQPLDVAGILRHAGVDAADSLCRAGYLRLWPHLHDTDGFFAAVWQRKA